MEEKTEGKILDAAKKIFIEKGLDGARMQEIANEAGINKALLHYYYRSKNQLFEAVYEQVFKEMLPKMYGLFMQETSLLDIIPQFFELHMEFLKRNPSIPLFILMEIKKVPDFMKRMMDKNQIDVLAAVKVKVAAAVNAGLIRSIKGEDLILNMLSLSVFQFAAAPMYQAVAGITEEEYFEIIDERKKTLAEFVINAIKK